MEYVDTLTPSGIRVITEPMPSMRSITIGLWFTVGSRDEAADQVGCSHFLEHLLFKGTTSRSARHIAEELDAIGGEANAFTSKETTCFYARVLDRDLPVALDVLSDMVRNATNSPVDVEAERDVVLEEINIHLDSPEDLVHTDVTEVLYDGHPLGLETLGSIESIERMQRDTIHDYFLAHYRPGNLVVVAAGQVEHAHVVELVERHLGDLGRPGAVPLARTAPDRLQTGRVHLRHRPTEQAHVVLGGRGLPMGDPRVPALRVATTILGGGMSSRLFQEIRETRGLAYSTYAYDSGHSDSGIVGAYAGTTPAKVDEVCKVLVDEMQRFAADLTAEEVARAKSSMTGSLVIALEDTGSRMTRLGRLATSGQDLYTVDEAIRRIDAVDLDQVRDVVAATYGAARSIAVVGPFRPGAEDRFAPYAA